MGGDVTILENDQGQIFKSGNTNQQDNSLCTFLQDENGRSEVIDLLNHEDPGVSAIAEQMMSFFGTDEHA